MDRENGGMPEREMNAEKISKKQKRTKKRGERKNMNVQKRWTNGRWELVRDTRETAKTQKRKNTHKKKYPST